MDVRIAGNGELGGAALQHCDDGAVSWLVGIQSVSQHDSGRAKILNDDVGIAGDEIAEMLGNQAAHKVVDATRGAGDQKGHGPLAIELAHGLRRGGPSTHKHQGNASQEGTPGYEAKWPRHHIPLASTSSADATSFA